MLGYGEGDLTLTPEGRSRGVETDLRNALAAFGGRTTLSIALPVNIREWVPQDDLAHLVLECWRPWSGLDRRPVGARSKSVRIPAKLGSEDLTTPCRRDSLATNARTSH